MKLHIAGNPEQRAIEEFMKKKADLGNFWYYFLAFSKNDTIGENAVGVEISKKATIEEAVQLIANGVNKLLDEESKKGRLSKVIEAITA